MANRGLLKANPSAKVGVYHYYHMDFRYSKPEVKEQRKMHGIKRVIVFCILIVVLPTILIITPLYLRRTVFADVVYPVAESDIIEIRDGISSIFCEQHSLRMNTHFNAFQLSSKPEISTNRKHIRLKKSMTLPDDTLEYWGFYLLKGALVHLKFCSRYDGSRILVVKGQRELRTCNLLDHNKNKLGANLAQGHEQVKVFFEDITEIGTNLLDTDRLMELENQANEELDDNDVNTTIDNILTPINPTTNNLQKSPRKKLKKASLNSTRSRISEIEEVKENLVLDVLDTNRIRKSSSLDGLSERLTRFNMKGDENLNWSERRKQIYDQLYKFREKRDHIYDRKYSHGGNAINFTETDESNSISSFETGLFDCFNGAILLAEGFPPSPECTNAHFLENGSHRMMSKHEITEDGYYYYIFYSDNDLVRNDIHAIFDIYKPTFQYSNISNSQHCVNATNCTFAIGFLSDELVVVEVPTRDGIEHEDDDITYLISTCHPRTKIYAIFPILVLVLLLSCSFL